MVKTNEFEILNIWIWIWVALQVANLVKEGKFALKTAFYSRWIDFE